MRPPTTVYFPNLIFTMVRSGVKRAPGEVVFRVPRFLNKLDIRAYIEGVYPGTRVSNVRIFNFLGRTTCNGQRKIPSRKNAIVTIARGTVNGDRPGYFPYPPEPGESELGILARAWGIIPNHSYKPVHPHVPVRIPSDRNSTLC